MTWDFGFYHGKGSLFTRHCFNPGLKFSEKVPQYVLDATSMFVENIVDNGGKFPIGMTQTFKNLADKYAKNACNRLTMNWSSFLDRNKNRAQSLCVICVV